MAGLNKYTNPRSKRKQKSKEKRQSKEMCDRFTQYPDSSLNGAYAQTPDEFLRAERNEPLSRSESGDLAKIKPLKPAKLGASGKTKPCEGSREPCGANASELNEMYRYTA